MRIEGKNYYVESDEKVRFKGVIAKNKCLNIFGKDADNLSGKKISVLNKIGKSVEIVEIAYDFAYRMTYGEEGEHNRVRVGGEKIREIDEVFCNTFQGKLGELALAYEIKNKKYIVSSVDTKVFKRGIWDKFDLKVRKGINNVGTIISVKSIKYYSELLLLEKDAYTNDGVYKFSEIDSDLYCLVKISPVCQSIIENYFEELGKKQQEAKVDKDDSEELEKKQQEVVIVDKDDLKKRILKQNWSYQIVGFITKEMFKKCIEDRNIIKKNDFLNGSVKMDATNYYYLGKNMIPFSKIGDYLNNDLIKIKK